MLTLPPQLAPVTRDTRGQDDEGDLVRCVTPTNLRHTRGVVASQSQCDGLKGPAQSMCYAALYGVYV